ncbi:MAG TPA: cupin domain-containing protein [Anaerolineae bacterium]|nr:cupin domain-containing protein [Anaerolineae bacterium]HRU94775.1 cupin domain-containing protein [Anaerolineae bacterium]
MMTQPQVQSLEALITVQPGAVVSREIVSRSAGTVTLFAFDADQGLSEHTAPYDALVYALEGAVEITVSGKPFTVNAGEMLIMPAHEPHGLKALSPFKMLLVMIRA